MPHLPYIPSLSSNSSPFCSLPLPSTRPHCFSLPCFQPKKKEKGSKDGPLRRQALLSARSQKKAPSQEGEGQAAPAPINQVVNPQAQETPQPLLPQLGPRPPQGAAGPGGGQPAPPEQQQQQRPQMMPQQGMMAGQRMPQAPMMPRIPSQQMLQQMPQMMSQMRAQQQQQMTMQQAAMRARAQMYGGQVLSLIHI